MNSNINKNKNLFISFCMLVTLPIAAMCLFGYLFSLLDGQTITSPALQAGLTKLLGFGSLALLYWLVVGVRSFFRQLPAEKFTVSSLPVVPPLTKPMSEKQRNAFHFPKWFRVAGLVMLILALIALSGMALTNPAYEEFKAFTPERNTTLHYAEWRKVHNYLLWSIYQKDIFERESRGDDFTPVASQQYRGMLLNFTPLLHQ